MLIILAAKSVLSLSRVTFFTMLKAPLCVWGGGGGGGGGSMCVHVVCMCETLLTTPQDEESKNLVFSTGCTLPQADTILAGHSGKGKPLTVSTGGRHV